MPTPPWKSTGSSRCKPGQDVLRGANGERGRLVLLTNSYRRIQQAAGTRVRVKALVQQAQWNEQEGTVLSELPSSRGPTAVGLPKLVVSANSSDTCSHMRAAGLVSLLAFTFCSVVGVDGVVTGSQAGVLAVGAQMSVHGQHFGPMDMSFLEGRFSGTACESTIWMSDSSMRAKVAAGVGTTLPVLMTMMNREASMMTRIFTFEAPTIVFSSNPFSGPNAPASGKTTVTIVGVCMFIVCACVHAPSQQRTQHMCLSGGKWSLLVKRQAASLSCILHVR